MFPMMAKVHCFGKDADVGENKAISHAANKKKKATGMPFIFMKDISLKMTKG